MGARQARMKRPEARRASQVSDERIKLMEEELARRTEVTRIFNQYDTNKSHKLEKDQVRKLLTDLDSSTPPDTPPSDEELNFIIKVADKAEDGCLARGELDYALRAWMTYIHKRATMEETLGKFDKSGTGKLERGELKEYLTHLNGGKEVAEDEVEWVLSEADVFGDGAMSKPELLMATSAWYAHVQESKNTGGSSCCTLQ